MRKWFKACLVLIIVGVAIFFVDLFYAFQIDSYFGYGRIHFFNYRPSVSLVILLIVVILFVLAYLAFQVGASPEIDNWLKKL